MSDEAVFDAALRDLATQKAKCREIEAFIDRYKKYKHAAVQGPRQQDVVPARTPNPSPAASKTPVTTNQLLSIVHDILEARGDAMPLGEIFTALLERGIIIGGRHPKHNLGQKLSADPAYKSYGKRGWYFADTPPGQKTYSHSHDWDENEEDPNDKVAGPSQSNGSEAEFSQTTSVPDGRDMRLRAPVSAVAQPFIQERSKNGLAPHQ